MPRAVSIGRNLNWPPFLSSKIAPKMLGESKCGQRYQSIESFMPYEGGSAHVTDDSVFFDILPKTDKFCKADGWEDSWLR